MRDNILALDLSLVSTGAARGTATYRITCKKSGVERLAHIRSEVMRLADGVDLVVIEGYSMGSRGRVFDIGELGGVIRMALHDSGITFVSVPPTSLKKFATGKGTAKKDDMLETAIRRFAFAGHGNDEADAWLLLKMAEAAYSGLATNTKQREAIAAVDWPILTGL